MSLLDGLSINYFQYKATKFGFTLSPSTSPVLAVSKYAVLGSIFINQRMAMVIIIS